MKKYYKHILFTVIGATGGFLYYYYIGCASGHCPITGNPYISTVYGGVLGFLFAMSPNKKNQKNVEE